MHKTMMLAGVAAALCSVSSEALGDTGGDGPTNANPEYQSFTLEINHLITEPFEGRGDELVVPMLWSSKNARQQLLNQIGYFQHFGAPNAALDDNLFEVIATGLNKDVIYVYTPNCTLRPAQTNVIVDAALWDMVLDNPNFGDGTILGAHKALIALAADMRANARAEGKDDSLVVFVPN